MTALADTRLRPAFAPLAAALARAHGLDREDLEQAVWLQALAHAQRAPLPREPVGWLRSLTLFEFRRALASADAEIPTAEPPRPAGVGEPEQQALAGELSRTVRAAVSRLPARCPELITALLENPDLTYRKLAEELGMPRGSIGPARSRCLACLRRLLHAQRPRQAG